MKKSTFLIILCALLTGCAIIESSPTYSSEAIRNAELQGTLSETSQEEPKTAYIITLNSDSLQVIDPETGKTILAEKYDSKSSLAKAILKDNE